MNMDMFETMLKSGKSEFDNLNAKLAAMNTFNKQDERFWQPTADKSGNGYAIIRFLPRIADEELPFVRVWDHGFKGPGGWYIENSLTSIGQDDPVTEYNNTRWAEGENSPGRRFVSGTGSDNPGAKRRLHYFSNIYVVEDPVHPENNGKVFLFKYGKRIFDKVNEAMNPKLPIDPKFNPFHLLEGANFTIRITRVDGQRSYAESRFDKPAPLLVNKKGEPDVAGMKAIWFQQFPLQPFLAPENFKSYDELKRRLDRVLNTTKAPVRATVEDDDKAAAPTFKAEQEKELLPWETDDNADDELAAFQALANK